LTDPDRGVSALEARAYELARSGDWRALHELLDRAERPDVLASPVLAYRFAEALYHTGRMRELRSFASRYHAAAKETADSTGLLRALNLGGIAAFELGDVGAAQELWEELFSLSETLKDEEMLARAANNLGAVADLQGDRPRALTYFRMALPIYQRLHQQRGLAQAYYNVAGSLRDDAQFEEAVAAFEQAVTIAEDIGYEPIIAMTLASRAELEIMRADPAVARSLADRALGMSRDSGDPITEGEALRVRGIAATMLATQSGRAAAEDGTDDLEAALELARNTGNRLLEAETLRDLGMARGRMMPALLEQSASAFRAMGAVAEADRILQLMEPSAET